MQYNRSRPATQLNQTAVAPTIRRVKGSRDLSATLSGSQEMPLSRGLPEPIPIDQSYPSNQSGERAPQVDEPTLEAALESNPRRVSSAPESVGNRSSQEREAEASPESSHERRDLEPVIGRRHSSPSLSESDLGATTPSITLLITPSDRQLLENDLGGLMVPTIPPRRPRGHTLDTPRWKKCSSLRSKRSIIRRLSKRISLKHEDPLASNPSGSSAPLLFTSPKRNLFHEKIAALRNEIASLQQQIAVMQETCEYERMRTACEETTREHYRNLWIKERRKNEALQQQQQNPALDSARVDEGNVSQMPLAVGSASVTCADLQAAYEQERRRTIYERRQRDHYKHLWKKVCKKVEALEQQQKASALCSMSAEGSHVPQMPVAVDCSSGNADVVFQNAHNQDLTNHSAGNGCSSAAILHGRKKHPDSFSERMRRQIASHPPISAGSEGLLHEILATCPPELLISRIEDDKGAPEQGILAQELEIPYQLPEVHCLSAGFGELFSEVAIDESHSPAQHTEQNATELEGRSSFSLASERAERDEIVRPSLQLPDSEHDLREPEGEDFRFWSPRD